jgi:hypothetical protein
MKTVTNLLPILLLLVIVSCVGLTAAQRNLWSLDVYDAQYRAYEEAVKDPNLTEDQKEVLRVKKQVLIELKPLVLMAHEYHKTGQLPPEDVQRKLTELINKLVEMGSD